MLFIEVNIYTFGRLQKMKGLKKLVTLVVAFVLCTNMLVLPVSAETSTQDGLTVSLTTDKSEYKQNEKITVNFSVKNENDFAVNNVFMNTSAPDGYKLDESLNATKEIDILNAGETAEIEAIFVTKNIVDNSNNDTAGSSKEKSDDSEAELVGVYKVNDESKESLSTSPMDTGDNSSAILWMIILVLATIVLIILGIVKRNKSKKILSLFLCVVLSATSIPISDIDVNAAGKIQKNISVKHAVEIADKEIDILGTVSYDYENDENIAESDIDSDGASDYIEGLFGTDLSLDDTDADGLSDYIEIYQTETDPLLDDTDGNGTEDGNEDADADGLTNLEELKIGTDLTKLDSDNDGLSDKDEVGLYKTNPIKKDTDDDSISDGNEILLGLDPLDKCTDGVTPDAKRTFKQTLEKSNIDEKLFDENEAIPSLSGEVFDNINGHVSLEAVEIYALEDNRASVGKQVYVSNDYSDEVKLKLEFDCSSVSENTNVLMVCRYEDGEIIPCDTKQDNKTIWTTVSEGYYFVMNAEALLKELDIPMDKYLSAAYEAVTLQTMSFEDDFVSRSNNVPKEWYEENYVLVDEEGTLIVEDETVEEDSLKETDTKEEEKVNATFENDNQEIFAAVNEDLEQENTLNGEANKITDSEKENSYDTEKSASNDTGSISSNEINVIIEDNSESKEIFGEPENANLNSTENLDNLDAVSQKEDIDEDSINSTHYVLSSTLSSPMMLAETLSASTSISGQADIVFVIDSTGSMWGAINNVVDNIEIFVDSLAANHSVKANFALVDYKDITCNEDTILVKNGSSNWFSDVTSFKSCISSIYVDGGGDGPETAIDALAMANTLDFRQNANKFVILVTDADYKNDNNYGVRSMAEMTQMLSNAGIVTSVISDSYYEPIYHDLYTNTGGVFGDIYDDFGTVLLELSDNIGEIVNDGSWVILSDYQYLKLDQPLEDENYSSDSDSLSDKEELGTLVEKDLSKYINWVLQAYGVPEELYKDQTSITVYKYKSNPLLPDTDFDGINDDKDSARKDNTFKGVMHYQLDKKERTCDVEFSVDYRELFKDNTDYSKNLSVLSVLYASDIYDKNYIEVKSGAKGGNDNATSFGKIFGLENVEDIKIKASDYSVDKDDISEFVVGHRTVEYNGETRIIIILSVRGTNSTNAEWSSNFDVGADTEEYYNALGSAHPQWKNKNNHKGFDVATNRIIEKFDDYVKRHNLNNGDLSKSILITGHSRGAAIANLLGAYFENNSSYKSYTYTFAAPFCTTESNAENYKTIMNIMNTDDLIPYLPLEGWGFKKYGKMFKISVAGKYEDKCGSFDERTFEWLVGYDYNNDGGTSRTINSFLKIAENREELYKLDTSDDGKVNIDNKYYTGKDKDKMVSAEKERVSGILDDAKLLRFCKLNIKGDSIKHVEVNYSPAYLMQNLANMASGKGPMTGYDTKGAYASAKASFIASSGFIPGGLIGGMTHPHQQPTYYLIAYNNFETIK